MRHQTENISFAVADAGDVFDRAIGIRTQNDPPLTVRIAQNHLLVGVQFAQRFRVGEEAAFPVRYRQAEKRPFWAAVGERRIVHFHSGDNHVAHEAQRAIADQCPWQQAGLAQNLKPVACAEHEFARARR